MKNFKTTPVVSKPAGAGPKLKNLGQKLKSSLTSLGSWLISSSFETVTIQNVEQKSLVINEGNFVKSQNQNVSCIESQSSKFEIVRQQAGQKLSGYANKLRKVSNYAAKFGNSLQQNWFGEEPWRKCSITSIPRMIQFGLTGKF